MTEHALDARLRDYVNVDWQSTGESRLEERSLDGKLVSDDWLEQCKRLGFCSETVQS